MNLIDLSAEYGRVAGTTLGFTVKSLAHPERKFKVEALLGNGKYAITRLDTNASYFVAGTEDRYDFVVSMARVRALKAEIVELSEQAATINARLGVLTTELGSLGAVVG